MPQSADVQDQLRAMVHEGIRHAVADTTSQASGVLSLPASRYFDEDIFKLEIDRIFKRLPLILAPSAELAEPGAYKTMTVLGMPILLVRGADGLARAFVNSCSHRGTVVATAASGKANRFMCPYHGWTFSQTGDLIGVASAGDFGPVDKSCLGLPALQTSERAGLIWVIVNPAAQLDIDLFLSGYDLLLNEFNFKNWLVFDKREVRGPNWKIAYDGYLDYYHLPVLHKATFGSNLPNRALYFNWGPHQRVLPAYARLLDLAGRSEEEWGRTDLLGGIWTIFPHVSLSGTVGGGRSVLLSQLLPGATVGESVTTQIYLTQDAPDPETAAKIKAELDLLEHVVRDEDYATGFGQQAALKNGGRSQVLFGKNEGGAQRFHAWVDRLLATEDADLPALFGSSAPIERRERFSAEPQAAM